MNSIEASPLASSQARGRRRYALLAVFTAIYAYALVVFGGVVRITDSGMGCGDDWPLCDGRLIPPFELQPMIEWTHRLLAAGLAFPILALLIVSLRLRGEAGASGPGGLVRPAALAAGLLVVQSLLGMVTVRLELPPAATVMHFGTAMILLAALIVAAMRGRALALVGADRRGANAFATSTSPTDPTLGAQRRGGRSARAALVAAVIGFLLVVFGALTANQTGAGFACQGFPLCNGQLIPEGAPLVHIHWTHRLLAFLLFLHVIGATIAAHRRGAPAAVARAATVALALIVLQLGVAAWLVLSYLPDSLQTLHLVVGVAAWASLVVWVTEARRASQRA